MGQTSNSQCSAKIKLSLNLLLLHMKSLLLATQKLYFKTANHDVLLHCASNVLINQLHRLQTAWIPGLCAIPGIIHKRKKTICFDATIMGCCMNSNYVHCLLLHNSKFLLKIQPMVYKVKL